MASSVPSAEDRASYEDRRLHPRMTVALPAFLKTEDERHFVQILDLSRGGAKLNCLASIVSGTVVTLDCGTLGRSAVVRWQEGAFLGLSFESELGDREIAALMNRSTALASRMK